MTSSTAASSPFRRAGRGAGRLDSDDLGGRALHRIGAHDLGAASTFGHAAEARGKSPLGQIVPTLEARETMRRKPFTPFTPPQKFSGHLVNDAGEGGVLRVTGSVLREPLGALSGAAKPKKSRTNAKTQV